MAACSRCGGSGNLQCEYCDGSGWPTCTSCNGRRTQTCTGCHGQGGQWRFGYNGASNEWTTCSSCGGTGNGACQTCNGSGTCKCYYCAIGTVTCVRCRGTGIDNGEPQHFAPVRPMAAPKPLSEEERRWRRNFWLGALGVAAVAVLIMYWNMMAAETARRAADAARAAELLRQSQELVRFLPERAGRYRRTGVVRPNPGAVAAATADYTLASDPRVSVNVRVTRWEYPDMVKIFRDRSGSFGLVNGRHAHESYRGLPAVLFTAGNNAQNYFASYTVLVAESIEVNASSGGAPEQAKQHSRAVVQAMPLGAISAWKRAN